MLIPLHLVSESPFSMPMFTIGGQSVDPALRPQAALDLASPIAGPLSGDDLQQFAALMGEEQLPLQPTRMLYDRLYAFDRLAAAHASASASLRSLALQLFQGYQQAGEWIGLIH
jgi:hypothetical protein